jgi:hypothetical protein
MSKSFIWKLKKSTHSTTTSVINIYHYIESNPSRLGFDPRYPYKVIRFPDSNTWTAGITGRGCVGRGPSALLCPGAYNSVKTALIGCSPTFVFRTIRKL